MGKFTSKQLMEALLQLPDEERDTFLSMHHFDHLYELVENEQTFIKYCMALLDVMKESAILLNAAYHLRTIMNTGSPENDCE